MMTEASVTKRGQRKRALIIAGIVLAPIVVLGLAALTAWILVRRSLPAIDGTLALRGPRAPIRIERDRLGVPTIRAESRDDLTFGLGFVHGQDRFFQMDGLRRSSAGELSEIFGAGPNGVILDRDRKMRVHRFRAVAREVVTRMDASGRRRLDAYVSGVRAGLGSLSARPFEYLLLGGTPRPWEAEDSILVILAFFIDMQEPSLGVESVQGLLRDVFPGPVADFLVPGGSRDWDAPMFGGPITPAPIPGPEAFDLRKEPAGPPDSTPWDKVESRIVGSNNWALAGTRTSDGRAWIANDMHLGIRVPNIWYCVCLDWTAEDGSGRRHRAVGVTAPGGPGIVVGSNGRIAWGLTNSYGDWSDLITLESPPGDPDRYLAPDGPRAPEKHREVIRVKGGADVTMEVVSTIWGPIYDTDHRGRKRALRWAAGDPDAVNLRLMDMATVDTLEAGLELASRCGAPQLSMVMADDKGRIGWTILGRIPRRRGFGGGTPGSWADGARGWDGYLQPSEYPRLVDPASGQLWSANARICDGKDLAKLGDGGYARGARAGQIRDALTALRGATPADLLGIQLDDRALFLGRWRSLLLEVLTPGAVAGDARREALRRLVEAWGGRASVDSVGYRMVAEFRLRTMKAVLGPLTSRCRAADSRFRIGSLPGREEPVWALVTRRPAHLLDPMYASWEALLMDIVDAMLRTESADGTSLAGRTWGGLNTARIQHPLSRAVPILGWWLDMPTEPLPGGWSDMPRIQGPDFGASERLVVSPGAEEKGIFHMPCGQSGHPLSPFYRAGHDDWVRGRATPLLPGPAIATLELKPHD